MKILIVGVFNVENSTNVFAAKALRELGQEVIEFDYRAIASQIGPTSMNAGLLYEVNRTKPDLVLIFKGDQLAVPVVQQLSKVVSTHYFFMDPIITAAPHFLKLAAESTTVSCTGGGVAQYFAENGCSKVFHIFEGVDTEYYKPTGYNPEFASEVSFIGSRTQERMDYIYHLGSKHLPRVYGYGFGSQVFGPAFGTICGSSQAMLSINTQVLDEYFSDRIFLYLACGSFVFQQYSPGLEKWFENKKHIVWFNTKEELLELADQYLIPEKEEERRQIAQAGYDLVIEKFTWKKSMEQLLGCVK